MQIALSVIGAVFAIFSIIVLHELGHFFVARCFGIKILRFSIGFGKPLFKKVSSKTGTEYVLALIPLGGYVRMLGEGETQSVEAHEMKHAFHRKPLLIRMAVVLAGPVTNFILAAIVFWGAYLVGIAHVKPVIGQVAPHSFAADAQLQPGDQIVQVENTKVYDWQQVIISLLTYMGDALQVHLWVKPHDQQQLIRRELNLSQWKIDQRDPNIFQTLGMYPYMPAVKPVILQVMPESPAAHAGLKAKDVIIAINGRHISDWNAVVKIINHLSDKKTTLIIQRGSSLHTLIVNVGSQQQGQRKIGYLGVMVVPPNYSATMIHLERYNIFTAWKPAFVKIWELTEYNAMVVVKMITSKLSIKTIGGPISIFQAAGQATQEGLAVYLNFIGFISLTIGFINLLPIPGLDGGHLLFQVIEGLIRRPIPEKIQQIGFTLGILFVFLLIVNATVNDLIRLFG